MWIYIGTYTHSKRPGSISNGIYRMRMDRSTGALSELELACEAGNPSFLALHPNGKFLYATNEHDTGDAHPAAVLAMGVDRASGKLVALNQQSTHGQGPCYVTVDRTGKFALAANYSDGTVAVLPVKADGSLGDASCVMRHRGSGPHPKRQQGPHAHCVDMDPSNRFALVCDLGLDQILVYRLDVHGKLSANEIPFVATAPGAGPRHLAFHPKLPVVYLINELDSTVDALSWDANSGRLENFQTLSTLADDFEGESTTAEIAVHPSGKFLYGSNRGEDTIAIYSIDQYGGKLTERGRKGTGGKTPRHFAIDPSGTFLIAANQGSDNLVVFRIGEAGELMETGMTAEVPFPVCVAIVGVGH